MSKIFVGIDPDVDKSGFAWTINGEIKLKNLNFFEVYKYLFHLKTESEDITELGVYNIHVYIEAGWLNKGNWRKKDKSNASINAKIGEYVGANHEVGKKLGEMCEHLEIPYTFVKPTKRKVKAITFNKLTGITQRTNQEQRDAFMLIFGRK